MPRSVTSRKSPSTGGRSRAGSRRAPSKRWAESVDQAECAPPAFPDEMEAGLARSLVFRKLPASLRARIDRAILMPSEQDRSVEQVASDLQLAERYGITDAALQAYVGKVEALMRPAVRSQVMAGVLSCLPRAYRRRLFDGSQVLLISRVLGALTDPDSGLTVAEMAKLAAILNTMSGARPVRAQDRAATREAAGSTERCDSNETGGAQDMSRLPESVRLLYGLPWPPEGPSSRSA